MLCPNCEQAIKNSWDFCVYCGTKLECKCGECGETILPSWNYCPSCGSKLSIEENDAEESWEEQDDDWYPFYDGDDEALTYTEIMYQYGEDY